MALEETANRSGEKLLDRIREETELEVRGFVCEVLTTAAKERAAAIQDERRDADSARKKALHEEGARVRSEVEQTWAAKLRAANDAAEIRFESGLREVHETAERQLARKVASIRGEGQKVLEAALEAARQESDRTLEQRINQVREEAERTIAAELAAAPAPVARAPEPEFAHSETAEILGRVLDGVRQLDQASRLTDVLDTLAERAGNEAPRVAVLIVQANRVRGWRFVGFGSTLDHGEARQVDLEFGEAGIVGRTVVTGELCSVLSGPNGVPADAEPAFTTLLPGVHAVSVPVLVGGQVMAVVYGDDTERRPAAAWRASLEVLARHTGHCLEALTAVRAAQLALQDVETLITKDAGPRLPFAERNDGASDAKPR